MSLSHRNQPTDLLCKSIDWFLCERDIDRKRVKYHYHTNYLASVVNCESDTTSIACLLKDLVFSKVSIKLVGVIIDITCGTVLHCVDIHIHE